MSSWLKDGKIIDGKAVAKDVRAQVAARAATLAERGVVPGLATVLIGDDPASHRYVGMKRKKTTECGMTSVHRELPATATHDEVAAVVDALAADDAVHGILVQLPLPDPVDTEAILDRVPPAKDVDGFHPANLGALASKGREPDFVPCTPRGCIELLDRAGVELSGANAVVLGRSAIVGMPAALLLTRRNATVTVCHSRTRDIAAVCREADVIVAAIGRPHMVKADWIKPGAAIIDVGTNVIEDASRKSGTRLVGDVDFAAALEVAGAITPVPGGVGPMTIAMLLDNTLRAAARTSGNEDVLAS